ncbi:MAG: ribosomal protein L25/ral stress protein Ctc [Naasia sp.]|jgi:large subunit ribosomal protein L25|uniref:50S ribosomal protein L25/general stress protein Ctc n=1 Tax=Naasia sp. TaxID=2546198 RepID=UPI002633D09B|nr:50S ribosomal protein L25/general stress protein Ctc [Naasia sp.]MCU1569432.1 ribosomal protein L25/ral stress protein Ctc [Naasia sp.]
MAEKIQAEIRDNFGKGAARKLRAAGKIPAVIYGHGSEPQHVSLPGHEVSLIIRKSNAVLDLDIAGKSQLALVKDVQKDPVRQIIEHLDLILVRSGERVQVEIAVHIEGETLGDAVAAQQDANTLTLDVEATHIPERITVSIEGLADGARILASDVTLPAGAILISDPDTLVIAIGGAVAEDEDEAAAAPAAE